MLRISRLVYLVAYSFLVRLYFSIREKAVICFDIKNPATYDSPSHLHSVWRPLRMYVGFSSERFSLCILFTFIKCCPARHFAFIAASGPSRPLGLCEKQSEAWKSQMDFFWEARKTRQGRCGHKNEPRSQAEALSLFCHRSVSCQSSAPPPTHLLTWETLALLSACMCAA